MSCLLVSSKLFQTVVSDLAPSTVKLKTQSLPPKSAASTIRNSKAKGVVMQPLHQWELEQCKGW